jgi:hypothetical protein
MRHWLTVFCSRVGSVALSHFLQKADRIVPHVQTIRIVAISNILSALLVFILQFIGVIRQHLPLERAAARFLPILCQYCSPSRVGLIGALDRCAIPP